MTDRLTRRGLLAATTTGAVSALAGCGDDGGTAGTTATTDGGTTDGTPDGEVPEAVGLEPLATGLRAPIDLAFVPGTDRRYVATQGGRILVHGPDGLADQPLLDLTDAVEAGGEKGLLGIALHPDFPDDRRLFVRYSAPSRAGTPRDYSHTFVLASVPIADDGTDARRGAERTVLEIPEPQSNHNAGDLAFGPTGLLYVAVGDGGGGGDLGAGHADDWYDGVGGGNGQDVRENLLGSVLRIDVDGGDDGGYAIPPDNPLVDRPGLDEHFAWGLRNPWRMSFDRGRLYVGDVGQNRYEEVSVVEKGGNYGWNVREGRHCYGASDCPDSTPDDVRGGEALREPIVEYPHSGDRVAGSSVIGGVIARDAALPGLEGHYVFGDLAAEGRLFLARRPEDGGRWPTSVLPVAGDEGGWIRRLLSFARGPDGEVYALGSGDDGGGVFGVVPAD